MNPIERVGLASIRGRLLLGFGILVLLLLMAGVVARSSFTGMSSAITASLEGVQVEARLSSALSGDVAKTIDAGSRYLETRDSAAQSAFRTFGWSAHGIQRQMNDRPGQSAVEVGIVAGIDNTMSAMEADYALAHRLVDLGRGPDAARWHRRLHRP